MNKCGNTKNAGCGELNVLSVKSDGSELVIEIDLNDENYGIENEEATNSLEKEQLRVHTENIPDSVRYGIGKAFFEAYRRYEAEKKEKEESEVEMPKELPGEQERTVKNGR